EIQAASTPPKGVAQGYNFVRPLALGLRHADVSKLQEALKTDSSVYPEGTVSGYFGPLTLKAVKKFQEKYGIASSGEPGYGNVGPKTREKLNELFK
ncbi:MAG: peptidoglycan-binding domain-containing protein, partial [Patescibacteria group bacterium]